MKIRMVYPKMILSSSPKFTYRLSITIMEAENRIYDMTFRLSYKHLQKAPQKISEWNKLKTNSCSEIASLL